MISNQKIKELSAKYGADLCGVAPVSRFEGAPKGFHPKDIFEKANSVVVFANRVPIGTVYIENKIPYTMAEESAYQEVSRASYKTALALEDLGYLSVPIPSIPYDYWDSEKIEGKGLLSFRHAGYLAGLGVMGRNSLLTNEKYGSLIKLAVLLTEAEIEADPVETYVFCKDSCKLCINACPVEALKEKHVTQKLCRPNSEIKNIRGAEITVCSRCRVVCPFLKGFKKK